MRARDGSAAAPGSGRCAGVDPHVATVSAVVRSTAGPAEQHGQTVRAEQPDMSKCSTSPRRDRYQWGDQAGTVRTSEVGKYDRDRRLSSDVFCGALRADYVVPRDEMTLAITPFVTD